MKLVLLISFIPALVEIKMVYNVLFVNNLFFILHPFFSIDLTLQSYPNTVLISTGNIQTSQSFGSTSSDIYSSNTSDKLLRGCLPEHFNFGHVKSQTLSFLFPPPPSFNFLQTSLPFISRVLFIIIISTAIFYLEWLSSFGF